MSNDEISLSSFPKYYFTHVYDFIRGKEEILIFLWEMFFSRNKDTSVIF